MPRQIYIDPQTQIIRLGGRAPQPIIICLALHIGLFLVYAFANGPALLRENFCLVPDSFFGGMLWQLFTAAWIHLTTQPLILNDLALWLFGVPLIRWWGPRRFFMYWLGTNALAMFCGALLSKIFLPHIFFGTAGGSAALLMAMAINWPRHLVFVYGLLPLQMRWLALLLGGFVALGCLIAQAYLDLLVIVIGAVVGALLLDPPSKIWIRYQARRQVRHLKLVPTEDPGKNRKFVN